MVSLLAKKKAAGLAARPEHNFSGWHDFCTKCGVALQDVEDLRAPSKCFSDEALKLRDTLKRIPR